MHVIWKRPDGFMGATPDDYQVIELDGGFRLWLHKSDHTDYPFRVSGGWEEEEATKRLNTLVNLLQQPDDQFVSHLITLYQDSFKDDPEGFYKQKISWIEELLLHLKGDSWEVEVLDQALSSVKKRLEQVHGPFLLAARHR